MLKRILAVLAIAMMTALSSNVAGSDNTLREGATKVEGGVKAVGKSAGEIGTKAGKAVEGAARDTRSALGKAWDNIVNGLRKAFK